jgi:U4/U6.U5 tri-snRNP-associated protein 2
MMMCIFICRGVLPKDMRRARNASSVVTETFQGQVEVRTFTKLSNSTNGNGDGARSPLPGEETKSNGHNGHGTDMDTDAERWKETTVRSPFNYLSLDIPPNPLFRDSQGGLIIPQIPLFEILKKYDGETYTDKATAVVGGEGGLVRKQYRLKQLPQYLVFHLARFTKNNFTYEKNPTIVTFPVKNLEMKDYLFVDGDGTDATSSNGGYPNAEEVDGMSVAQLKAVIGAHGSVADKRTAASVVEKNDLKELAQQCSQRAEVKWRQQQGTKYDLVANICHDTLSSQSVTANLTTYSSAKQSRSGGGGLVVPGTTTQQNASTAGSSGAQTGAQAAANAAAGGASVAAVLANGSYRIHVLNKATGQWYEIQDLHVSETMPQLIGLSESYILVYEKQVAKT